MQFVHSIAQTANSLQKVINKVDQNLIITERINLLKFLAINWKTNY